MLKRITSFSVAVLLLLAVPVLFESCKKDESQIPEAHLDIYIHINDPAFINLNAVGGWVYVTGGVRGIVVYRKSISEFMAYDRACTYDPNNPSEYVKVDSSQVMVKDDHCGSKLLLSDGYVVNGPASLPLKSYQTSFDGNVVHIWN